ncbi:MFS transporter [soil metagenome]
MSVSSTHVAGQHSRSHRVRSFIASLSGTTLEFYDFAVYSVASALVFPLVFFTAEDPINGIILSFGTYAVGYVSRPLGGLIFGRLGDKVGRRRVLVVTLLLIGVATVLIGLLPGYVTIGVAAPLILVILRFAQGVGLGGEWSAAVLISAENGDPSRRGFWSSAAQVGPPAGTLLANGALALLSVSMPNDAFLAWGWRVAFLFSAVLIVVGIIIRLKLEETPVFEAIEASGTKETAPLREVFTHHVRALFAAGLARVCADVVFALFTVFVGTYWTTILGLERNWVLLAVLIGSGFQLFFMPMAGALSDRINRRALYGASAIGAAIWVPIFFTMIQGGSVIALIVGMIVGLMFHALMYGPQAAYITEQFPARVRNAGSSMAYTLFGLIGGAIAPLIFTALLGAFGTWVPIAAYIGVTALVTLLGLALGRNPQAPEAVEVEALRAQGEDELAPAAV